MPEQMFNVVIYTSSAERHKRRAVIKFEGAYYIIILDDITEESLEENFYEAVMDAFSVGMGRKVTLDQIPNEFLE